MLRHTGASTSGLRAPDRVSCGCGGFKSRAVVAISGRQLEAIDTGSSVWIEQSGAPARRGQMAGTAIIAPCAGKHAAGNLMDNPHYRSLAGSQGRAAHHLLHFAGRLRHTIV